jgi:hypothetical protein
LHCIEADVKKKALYGCLNAIFLDCRALEDKLFAISDNPKSPILFDYLN